MTINHAEALRKAAAEIRAENHAGWGNTCEWAADAVDASQAEIERLRAALDEIAMMGGWQCCVPIDTEAANEHARIASTAIEVALAALSGSKE